LMFCLCSHSLIMYFCKMYSRVSLVVCNRWLLFNPIPSAFERGESSSINGGNN